MTPSALSCAIVWRMPSKNRSGRERRRFVGRRADQHGCKGENAITVMAGANGHLSPVDIDANVELLRRAGIVLTHSRSRWTRLGI